MPWTRKQVRYLLSKGSPLSGEQKSKMVGELHEDPSMGHKKKGSTAMARHTIKGNRGAEKPKPGSGMAYSKGSSIFGVPKDIANKDGYSAAGHENRGKNKSLKGKGGHPGEGHKGHAPGSAKAFRDGHGGTLDHQKGTHDGIHHAGHLKRHTFHKIQHPRHSSKMDGG